MSRKTKKARADAHRSPVRADSCLSGFGLCHVIQFPLRPSAFCGLSLRSRSALASPIRLADPPRRIASGFSPTLPWGKNPARRWARGISGSGENFNCPGGGLQGTPQARAWASACPSVRRFPPRSAPLKQSVFAHFRRSLAAVAAVTKAL